MTHVILTSIGYGNPVGLRVAHSDVEAVRTWLPFWWREEEVDPQITWNVPTAVDAELVVRELELWVAEHAVDRVFVHAGVIAFADKALLLPGRSYSGKSTLVTALLRLGAAYGSDEYAVLDAQGLVHPYPRAISRRETDGTRTRVNPVDLGAMVIDRPLSVEAIAFLRRVEGAAPAVSRHAGAAAVLDLLDNTVCARTRPADSLTACAAAISGCHVISGIRGEAASAALDLREMLMAPDPGA